MDKKKQKREIIKTIAIPLIIVLTSSLCMMYFQHSLELQEKENTFGILRDSTIGQTKKIEAIFAANYSILEGVAGGIAQMERENIVTDISAVLESIVSSSSFENVGFALADGILYNNKGKKILIKDRNYFVEAMAGRRNVEVIENSRINGEKQLVFAVPIKAGTEVRGIVCGIISKQFIKTIIEPSAFHGNAYAFICDMNGRVLMEADRPLLFSDAQDVLSKLEQITVIEGKTPRLVLEDMKNKESGVMQYLYNEEKRYSVYVPLGFNDWYIFNIVDSKVVDKDFFARREKGLISIGVVTFCSMLMLAFIYIHEARRAKVLREMQKKRISSLLTDKLTGIFNEMGFESTAAKRLEEYCQSCFYAIVDMDINLFSNFNALYGFDKGNLVLKELAVILADACGAKDACARVSADHFVCLLSGKNLDDIVNKVQTIEKEFHDIQENKGIRLSYGIYAIDDYFQSVSSMRDKAMAAKRTIKGDFQNCISIYDSSILKRSLEETEMINVMEQSMAQGEFVAYYQPKFDTYTEKMVGAEALVRWLRPGGEVKPPDRYMKLFENNGLITKLDWYIYEQVCKKLRCIIDKGERVVPISVNFSRVHFYSDNFVEQILDITDRYGLEHSLLEIEVTETVFWDDEKTLVDTINELHKSGFLVSIDDFGSGFSSLNMLKDVNFDIIKIDRGFLSQTSTTERSRVVVGAVLALAKRLGLQTVAEGVETAEQLEFLRKNGCNVIQGYYFSMPISEAEFDKLRLERDEYEKNDEEKS